VLFADSRADVTQSAKCRRDGGRLAKKFKLLSRQRSNFATSGAAAGRECVEEIKRFLLLVLDYVATEPTPEADEYRAIHK
jgi:hypothetical protein